MKAFYPWLMQQRDRDDPIGDLAADVQRDKEMFFYYFANKTNVSLKKFYAYLQTRFACSEALDALIAAYREWQSEGNTYRKTRDDIPQSAGWLKLRFRVLKRDGYACQLCGRTAQDKVKLEVDHRHPRSKGGNDDMGNLWTLCFECNRGKRDESL